MHRPVTRHENSKGEYTMKIQLKSSRKIMPLQTGKRVRTCLMVGEIYNTPLEYVRAVLKSDTLNKLPTIFGEPTG
jgi:hypothetical protein